jgi:hypothetical protein
LDIFVKTSGVADLATVIQDETFSIFGLMKLSDTTRDPKIYPQDAVLVFNTVKAVLAKFSRIWAANRTGRPRAQITSHFLDRIVFSANLFLFPPSPKNHKRKQKKKHVTFLVTILPTYVAPAPRSIAPAAQLGEALHTKRT